MVQYESQSNTPSEMKQYDNLPVEEPPDQPQKPPVEEPGDSPEPVPPPAEPPVREPPNEPATPPVKEPPTKTLSGYHRVKFVKFSSIYPKDEFIQGCDKTRLNTIADVPTLIRP